MSTGGWVILGIVNIPVYIGLGWVWFRDWEDFWESVRFWITPDLISALRGEYMDDIWGELKLGFWIASCAACVVGEAYLIGRFFG